MPGYRFLYSLQKPGRYIGNEINSCIKDPGAVSIRVALVFPDAYEIGESNLALKILYEILNKRPDIWAERVYAPWKDAEGLLIRDSIPLISLESCTPVNEFDFLGITLPSELCYSNILTILRLGRVPIHASDRQLHHPVVIGGGPGAANPEPLADFFDLFVLGDGEEVILDIMDRWLDLKGKVRERRELVHNLSAIEGVYAPHLFTPEYKKDGTIKEIRPQYDHKTSVHRRMIWDLDSSCYPESQIVSTIEAVHDRIAVEIARGCTRGCRFCQAGMVYRPPRERSISRIMELSKALICSTGHEEVSLLSLSSGDYSRLEELICLLRRLNPGVDHLVFSFPSLRPNRLPAEVLKLIREGGRKPGFTFAPEAGSERLRSVINKGISGEEILGMAEQIFFAGWDAIKLYFMIGLPTETEADLIDIVRLIKEMGCVGKRILKKMPRFNITISPFTPKPHTPFQWVAQDSIGVIKDKQALLKDRLPARIRSSVQLKFHSPEQALIEAVLARGDRRICQVIEKAWDLGARFDQWSEVFDFSKWLDAFDKTGIDPSFYANRVRAWDEIFPWSHLHMGVDEAFLKQEYEKAMSGVVTPDCRMAGCHGCGACPPDKISCVEGVWLRSSALQEEKNCRYEPISPKERPDLKLGHTKMRIRLKYNKTGDAIFFSHLGLIRTIILAVRRAKLPVSYTQGFHPAPRISFGPALPVGMEGVAEYMDINLVHSIDPGVVMERLRPHLPKGIEIIEATQIDPKSRALSALINEAHYSVFLPKVFVDSAGPFTFHFEAIQKLIKKEKFLYRREGKNRVKELDIRPFILAIELYERPAGLEMALRVKMTPSQNVRPLEILEAIYGTMVRDWNCHIRIARTGLFISI